MNKQLRKYLISSFFDELNQLTEYAILHHIDKIYSTNDDIDFIVGCSKLDMLKFVKKFVKKNNAFLINHYMIDIDIYRFDIFYLNNNLLEKIELDCACNSVGDDLLSINSKKLIHSRIIVDIDNIKFYKVSNNDEIEYYIKKKTYKNSNILTYLDYFKSLDSKITEKEIMEKYTHWSNYFKSFLYKTKTLKNKIYLLTNRLFHKQSLSISFLGPDGAGKSTIIDLINKYPLYINNYYFHLKPILQKKTSIKDEMITDPHKYNTYSKSKSYLKLLYFIYQYNKGWFTNISKLRIKSSLIIFDRYFDDLIVDNKRYRYGGSKNIAKLARLFIPKPDIYFILTADADIIYERKQEVSFEELQRQILEYKSLADNKRYFNIDVNRTPEEIVKEITNIIMEKMNERY